MKAYQLHAVGDLRYEDINLPKCPNGWCIVKVKAAGICSSDIPRIFKNGTYHFPTIPGHEFSGIVDQVADERDSAMIGKKVGVFPLIPCKNCNQCLNHQYEMCSHYDYIGSRRDGGFAEYVAVPIWNIIELEDEISFVDAAMMEPLSVAFHAIERLAIQSGDRVGIVGTGMIAFAAAQWAKKKGAVSVTVFGRTEQKRAIVNNLGDIEFRTDPEHAEQFDAVLEAVGSEEAINQSIELVIPGGKLVLMGNPAKDITLSQATYWRILRKQLSLMGTWNSSYEKSYDSDWSEVKRYLTSGAIRTNELVTHVFSQDRLLEGLNIMREHKTPYCKVMTLWNEE